MTDDHAIGMPSFRRPIRFGTGIASQRIPIHPSSVLYFAMQDFASPKRCVIADDVRASRETVGSWLRECGFDCVLAENGQHAWELIECQTPDLLITDLEMPNLSGLELLKKIRQANDARLCHLPVMIMTSLRDGQTLNIVRQMGGDGLLQKPLNKQTTLAVILDLVAGQKCVNRFAHPRHNSSVQGKGVISPTLRRLLKSVAKNELS